MPTNAIDSLQISLVTPSGSIIDSTSAIAGVPDHSDQWQRGELTAFRMIAIQLLPNNGWGKIDA